MSIFSKIPVRKPKLVPHDLSATIDFSTQFGRLTPLKMEKVVPGDIIPVQTLHQEQFAPLASKLYQDYRVKTETFFVPSRILWDDFGKFFVAENNTYLHPTFTPASVFQNFTQLLCAALPNLQVVNGDSSTVITSKVNLMYRIFWNMFGPSSCFHYLFGSCLGYAELAGLTAFASDNSHLIAFDKSNLYYYIDPGNNADFPNLWKEFDALRWAAYYRVLCEYYVDENLQSSLMEYVVDTPIISSSTLANVIYRYVIQYLPLTAGNSYVVIESTIKAFSNLFHGFFHRCWPKDYFSGALPFKQAGNAVEIPLSGNGVLDIQLSDTAAALIQDNTLINNVNLTVSADQSGVQSGYTRVSLDYQNSTGGTNGAATTVEPLQTNLTVGGLHTTIEDFRTAYQLQEWLEKNARGGTRYKEQIFSHFGIRTKDSRLDRPEFIVGSTDSVNYGNVFTTFQNANGDGVPAESVTAISSGGRSRTGVYRVTEHGYIFTIHSIYPTASYALGLYRQGFELDKFDYFWPEFQHLGEQEVFKCELNGSSPDSDIFGYQPRYAQYKTRSRQVHGDFIDSLPTFTSFRHVGKPSLNPTFITILPQTSNLDRVFNYLATDFDKIYCSVRIVSPALRPIDYYGVPRLFI